MSIEGQKQTSVSHAAMSALGQKQTFDRPAISKSLSVLACSTWTNLNPVCKHPGAIKLRPRVVTNGTAAKFTPRVVSPQRGGSVLLGRHRMARVWSDAGAMAYTDCAID